MQAKTDKASPVLTKQQLQKLIEGKLKRAHQQSKQTQHFISLDRNIKRR
jgi:hypothetical protein